MANVLGFESLQLGSLVWLEAYDDDEYRMMLYPARITEFFGGVVGFKILHPMGSGRREIFLWDDDYNYRFGWRCWDRCPSRKELFREDGQVGA